MGPVFGLFHFGALHVLFCIAWAVVTCLALYKLIGYKPEHQSDKWICLVMIVLCPVVGAAAFLAAAHNNIAKSE